MRGVVAKRIRREVYGDQSQRAVRGYAFAIVNGHRTRTLVSRGLRREYQLTKREYKRLGRPGALQAAVEALRRAR